MVKLTSNLRLRISAEHVLPSRVVTFLVLADAQGQEDDCCLEMSKDVVILKKEISSNAQK